MRGPQFGAVMTACVLFCFGLAGCSTIQSETDEDAAACADYAVPDALRKELGSRGLTSPTVRADAAQTWFNETMPTDISLGGHWVVRSREGTRLRVDFYVRVESGSLLPPDGGNRHTRLRVGCMTWPLG